MTDAVHALSAGVLHHDTDNLWSGFSREKGLDINVEAVFQPVYPLLHGKIRPNIGLSMNTAGDTSKVYGGGLWEYLWSDGMALDFGAGLAAHNGERSSHRLNRKQLGSSVLLHFSLEVGYPVNLHQRLSVYFDHISNGYTVDPNEGLDSLGLRYSYLF